MVALVTNIVAIILTLCVLSRILGNNPLFRIAQYLFVGVSLGYIFVVLYHQVLLPSTIRIVTSGVSQPALTVLRLVPLLLWLLLLPRIIGRQTLSWLANIPLGLIFGVGAGIALIGSLAGTLMPQLLDTARPLQGDIPQIAGTILLVLGVIVTLSYFYFTVPDNTPTGSVVAISARVGRWLLMIAFGFFFAGSLLTYLTALSERFEFMVSFVMGFLS